MPDRVDRSPELEAAVGQFHAALEETGVSHYPDPGWVDGDTDRIVKALLAAGWRPPEREAGFVWTQFEDWTMRVDPRADMGYIRIRDLREGEHIDCTDRSYKARGVIIDRDANGQILGLEIFLRAGEVRPESAAVIRRLLAEVRR